MKLKGLFILLLTIFMAGISIDADAQRNRYKKRKYKNRKVSRYKGSIRGYGRFKPYYFIGGNINAGNYFGDLAPVNKAASTDISFTRPGFGIHGGYKLNHSLAIRGALNWYRVYGDDFASDPTSEEDSYRYIRNLSFRNDVMEFQAGFEIYLFPNYGSIDRRLPFNGYVFIGGAIYLHDPKGLVPELDFQGDGSAAPQAGEWVKLRPLQTEGVDYSNIEFSIPISVGATFSIPRTDWNVGVEFGLRYLFTDYIDDVSTTYLSLDSFGTDEDGTLARIMSERSLIPTSSTGEDRNLEEIFAGGNLITQSENGFSQWIGSTEGSQRGGAEDNDLIFVTQLKLTYLISKRAKRGSKFR